MLKSLVDYDLFQEEEDIKNKKRKTKGATRKLWTEEVIFEKFKFSGRQSHRKAGERAWNQEVDLPLLKAEGRLSNFRSNWKVVQRKVS